MRTRGPQMEAKLTVGEESARPAAMGGGPVRQSTGQKELGFFGIASGWT